MVPLNPPLTSGTLALVALDFQLLRTFVTVAEVGSITGAARLLAQTQSTASLQLQRLEEQLETTLFSRSKRGVEVTAAGEAFLVYARRILALSDEAVRSVRHLPAGGQIRVGLPDVEAIRYLPDVLARLAERHPGVQPMVHCDVSTALGEMFDRGELDVCLTLQHHPAPRGTVLGADSIVWVAAPELELDPGEPVPLALYPEYCVFRARGLRALAAAHRPWRVVYTSQSTAAIDIAIDRGWAVAIKSARTLEPGWKVLGEAEGMPPLEPVNVELRRSPAPGHPAADELAAMLEEAVRADLVRGA